MRMKLKCVPIAGLFLVVAAVSSFVHGVPGGTCEIPQSTTCCAQTPGGLLCLGNPNWKCSNIIVYNDNSFVVKYDTFGWDELQQLLTSKQCTYKRLIS